VVHVTGIPSTLPRQRVGELQHLASGEHHPLHHVLLREVVQLQHPNLGLVQAHTLCLHLLAVLSGEEAGHLLVLSEGGVGSLPLFTNVVRGQRPELKQMLTMDLFQVIVNNLTFWLGFHHLVEDLLAPLHSSTNNSLNPQYWRESWRRSSWSTTPRCR
jgi:hypothetical protein